MANEIEEIKPIIKISLVSIVLVGTYLIATNTINPIKRYFMHLFDLSKLLLFLFKFSILVYGRNNFLINLMKNVIYFMIGSFILIFWIQSMDKNIKKKSKFDRFKFPIITAALIGLISEYIPQSQEYSPVQQQIFTEIPNF